MQKEKYMQFSSFDNRRHHQQQESSYRPLDAARSFSQWAGNLFRNPLVILLLVWALMFLMLGVTLAYAQDAGHTINQRSSAVHPRAETDHKVSDKKTETVEIFSAGEDLVIPPRAITVKALPRRRAGATHHRAQR
ncbi:MAG: hypothetical protein ACREA2_06215 [Blastocatellia bacterium]